MRLPCLLAAFRLRLRLVGNCRCLAHGSSYSKGRDGSRAANSERRRGTTSASLSDDVIYFFGGREPRNAEAQGGIRERHRSGPRLSEHNSAPATPTCRPSPVDRATSGQRSSRASPSTPANADVGIVRQPLGRMTVQRRPVNASQNAVNQPVAQARQMRLLGASSFRQISAALPKPTMPGTFSVPDRIPCSWPPPSICAVRRTRGLRRRTYSAPTPFGPCILCAVSDIRSIGSVLHVNRHLADALGRIGMKQNAALPAERPDLGDGLKRPDLIVAHHH